jgi:hypothetical protein
VSDEKMEDLATRVSVADISSAVAFGLQRALEVRSAEKFFLGKHLIVGGRLEFNIQVIPQVGAAVQEIRPISQG